MTLLRDLSFVWSMLHIVLMFLILFESRCSWRRTMIAGFASSSLLLIVNVLVMFHWGHGIIMNVAFFTCTVPTLVIFYLLSQYRDGRFFFLFCFTDTTCFWLLQITNLLDRAAGGDYVVLFITRLLAFPLVEYLFWRYLRRPCLELQRKLKRGWWLFAAVGLVYYLLIMFTAVPVDAPVPDATGMCITGLVMLLMPLTYGTIFLALWQQMRNFENIRQLELQKQNYTSVCQKIELGRIYRHDMRHHLAVLHGMIQRQREDALRYIEELSGKLDGLTQTVWCANAAVDAVLSAYMAQAEQEGCQMSVKIALPAQLPFEDTDLCVALANPLENAINACRGLPEQEKKIELNLELTDNQRLTLSIINPCPNQPVFDSNGLPVGRQGEEHGLGLRSVKSMADSYGGLLRCQWEDGRFFFRMVLMPRVKHDSTARTKRVAGAILGALLCLIMINTVPTVADALEAIPILGGIVRVFDLRSYSLFWKDSELTIHQPGFTSEEPPPPPEPSSGLDQANEQINAFVEAAKEKFIWYAEQKFNKPVAGEIDYSIVRDDEEMLVLRMYLTVNAASTMEYSRHVTVNKQTNDVLELKDLFLPDVNYVAIISREIEAQMAERNKAGHGEYFVAGSTWREDVWFDKIAPDQDFYLNDDGDLVIVFERYSVAPGALGSPEFIIPLSMLAGMLA